MNCHSCLSLSSLPALRFIIICEAYSICCEVEDCWILIYAKELKMTKFGILSSVPGNRATGKILFVESETFAFVLRLFATILAFTALKWVSWIYFYSLSTEILWIPKYAHGLLCCYWHRTISLTQAYIDEIPNFIHRNKLVRNQFSYRPLNQRIRICYDNAFLLHFHCIVNFLP